MSGADAQFSSLSLLRTLKSTQESMKTLQIQLATGRRINTSSDNPAIWATTAQLESDNCALDVVQTCLAQGKTMVQTASDAVTASITVMNAIKSNLVAAKSPGADLEKIGSDLKDSSKQLASIVDSSSYNGQNWVDGSKTFLPKIVAGFKRFDPENPNAVTRPTAVQTISIPIQTLLDNSGGGGGFVIVDDAGNIIGSVEAEKSGILDGARKDSAPGVSFRTIDINAPGFNLDDAIGDADATLSALQDYACALGAVQTRLVSQSTFIKENSDAVKIGVGALVDADLNETAAHLQALQTQQLLAVQSLAIVNYNMQKFLELFGLFLADSAEQKTKNVTAASKVF